MAKIFVKLQCISFKKINVFAEVRMSRVKEDRIRVCQMLWTMVGCERFVSLCGRRSKGKGRENLRKNEGVAKKGRERLQGKLFFFLFFFLYNQILSVKLVIGYN